MKKYRLKLPKIAAKSDGDTIVEVLIAIVIITVVMMASYTLSRHSLQSGLNANQRTEAATLAQKQIEYLKNAYVNGLSQLNNYKSTADFCIRHDTGEAVPVSDPSKYCQNYEGSGYDVSVHWNGVSDSDNPNTFTVTLTWSSNTSGSSDNSLALYYKVPLPTEAVCKKSDANVHDILFVLDFSASMWTQDYLGNKPNTNERIINGVNSPDPTFPANQYSAANPRPWNNTVKWPDFTPAPYNPDYWGINKLHGLVDVFHLMVHGDAANGIPSLNIADDKNHAGVLLFASGAYKRGTTNTQEGFGSGWNNAVDGLPYNHDGPPAGLPQSIRDGWNRAWYDPTHEAFPLSGNDPYNAISWEEDTDGTNYGAALAGVDSIDYYHGWPNAIDILQSQARPKAHKVVLFISDGIPTEGLARVPPLPAVPPPINSSNGIVKKAKYLKDQLGVELFTIGIGTDNYGDSLLKTMSGNGGTFAHVDSQDELREQIITLASEIGNVCT